MATDSLPQDKLTEFRPISVSAVHVLARLAARKAVQEQLRADGVRVSLVKPAEISARAQSYLADHPELYSGGVTASAAPGHVRKAQAPICCVI
jgi:hypothetical protein